jgi:hypothetical protein
MQPAANPSSISKKQPISQRKNSQPRKYRQALARILIIPPLF